MAGTLVIDTVKSATSGPPAFRNTSDVEVGQLCRAWVNMNGTAGTIRASFNVSSVVRNGTGDYTVNFSNAMADANYCVSYTVGSGNTGSFYSLNALNAAPSASSLRVNVGGTNGQNYDGSYTYVAIFR